MADLLLDRSLPPALQPNRRVQLPPLESFTLSNGMPVHLLQMGRQPVLELSIVYPAGKSFEKTPGLSSLVNRMLSEGTRSLTGYDFARKLDAYGASIDTDSGYESATVSLTTLSKHMHHTLPLLREMVTEPRLDAADFELLVKRTLNSFAVEEQKTEFAVRREFPRLLFGAEHPYGRHIGSAEVAALRLEEFAPFHTEFYAPDHAFILAAGRFETKELLDELEAQFGGIPRRGTSAPASAAMMPTAEQVKGFHVFPKDDARQASLRAGHTGFRRDHEDYYAMEVTNMIFGGYFSSRLNKNIREDKGYTYGIHSSWVSLRYGGYLVIQTDVGNEHIQHTLDEIRSEMMRLQDAGTKESELSLVKNYMLSRLVSSRETPAQLVETLCALFVNGIPYPELDLKFDRISAITAEQVQSAAQKWFRPQDMLEVVSGKWPAQ